MMGISFDSLLYLFVEFTVSLFIVTALVLVLFRLMSWKNEVTVTRQTVQALALYISAEDEHKDEYRALLKQHIQRLNNPVH